MQKASSPKPNGPEGLTKWHHLAQDGSPEADRDKGSSAGSVFGGHSWQHCQGPVEARQSLFSGSSCGG